MAEIAKTYHDSLQRMDLLPPDDPARREAQATSLNDSLLHNLITRDQILQAIRSSKNGTATGLDGIPYERVWKTIIERGNALRRKDPSTFDPTCLSTIYNDIQSNGMKHTTGFSNGWMCPIYKKKLGDE